QHAHVARGDTVDTVAVIAQRPVVAQEGEARERGAQPEVVILVAALRLVERADGRVHVAPEHRHDEDGPLVADDRGEYGRGARSGIGTGQLTVLGPAEIPA